MYNNYNPYMMNRGRINFQKPKINWKGFLNGTQKALNIVNQAIPLIYQIKPIYNNAKTIFRVMGSIKDDSKEIKQTTVAQNNTLKNVKEVKQIPNESPTFFL